MRTVIPFITQPKQLLKSNKIMQLLLMLFLLNTFIIPACNAQCSAEPGILAGSGNLCIGASGNIGIPTTLTNQTYTWYKNGSKIVKGPVNGNGDAISYNFAMTPGDAGHYTVVTAKDGCSSTEFGDVTITYIGSPKGLTTTAIGFDSVSFKWNSIAGASGYEYAIDNDSAPPVSGTFTTNTTASKNSLEPFTTYYIHVRPNTLDGGDCEWSTLKFKTIPSSGPGSLDISFNKTGKITTPIANGAEATAQAIQDDGKLIVAGSSYHTNEDFTLIRYTASGKIDSSFGNKGKAVTNLGGNDQVRGIALQSNGKILAVGRTDASVNDIALVRYQSNGKIDKAFGTNGRVFINVFGNYLDQIFSIAIQSSGKIIVAGYSVNNTSNADIILARFNTNGSLDKNFGTGGIVATDFGVSEVATAIAIQSDDKIIATGYSHDGTSSWDFLTVRYTKNGKPDLSFGTNGKVYTDFGEVDQANGLIIQASGKIIVAGSTHDLANNYSNIALARYTPEGTLDNTFGSGGKTMYVDASSHITGNSIAASPSNKFAIAGSVYNGAGYDFALIRFFLNGSLDSAFGYNGKIITDFNLADDFANAVSIQTDNKIIVSGSTVDNTAKQKIVVARYNSGSTQTFAQTSPVLQDKASVSTNTVSTILISPNPVKNLLTIRGLAPSISKTIYISDAMGSVLKIFKTSADNYSCAVNTLSAGMYYVCIQQGKKLTYLKFIKE